MKNIFFILIGILAVSASAHAQAPDASEAQSIKNCVGVMLGNEKMTPAKAEYICANPYLEPRESDSIEQEGIREEFAADQAQAKEDMARPYLEDNAAENN